jgi:hypothetical protein
MHGFFRRRPPLPSLHWRLLQGLRRTCRAGARVGFEPCPVPTLPCVATTRPLACSRNTQVFDRKAMQVVQLSDHDLHEGLQWVAAGFNDLRDFIR